MPSLSVCCHRAAAARSDSARSLVRVSSAMTARADSGSSSAACSASNCPSICRHTATTSAAAEAATRWVAPPATRSLTNATTSRNPESWLSAESPARIARSRIDDDAGSTDTPSAARCWRSSSRMRRHAG